MDGVRFRRMTRDEVEIAISFAAAEGWNPGRSDAECFYHTDPDGFFCAESGGKVVGTISVVNYSPDFAFAGLFVVDPAFRAHGIGMQLYRFALRHAGARVVGGDGVIAMVEKYRKDGGLFFHHNNARYAGTGGGPMPPDLEPAEETGFSDLAAFDAEHFPARRETFLRNWIGRPGHFGLVKRDGGGAICGFGVRRVCRTGYKIGPLFARDRTAAEQVLDGLVAGIPGETFFLDIPCTNAGATSLVAGRHLQPVFSTARLYSKENPALPPIDEIYGITTFELG